MNHTRPTRSRHVRPSSTLDLQRTKGPKSLATSSLHLSLPGGLSSAPDRQHLTVLVGLQNHISPYLKASSSGGKKPYTGKYDPSTGLGRGAPGFTTNVARIPVPAHIVARIRAGEEVSAEEITAAQDEVRRKMEREEREKRGESEEEQAKSKKGKKGKRR
ncbi:zinc-binding oxidoreductase [Ceraceosorus bombacis]|uniref:Zinc-binding oxidoreductase n=1 Tax=Ceraceosorus bombacis TaxID=401625 RepID=A0A0P1BS65_9BASI|nr:zinc-binding oxidoreductase [Ceraceosorus bombacis]